MTVTIDNAATQSALLMSNARAVARTSTGRLWCAFMTSAGAIEFWYSDDNGATWAQNTSATISSVAITTGDGMDFRIDIDDHAHVAYGDTSEEVWYRRMPSIGVATSWGSAVEVQSSIAGSGQPCLAVHREGTGWVAHVAYWVNGSAFYNKVTTTSGGVSTPGTSIIVASGGNTPVIDFRHTGDGKTVQGLPHLYLGYWNNSGNFAFKKGTYSGGTWTWGAERILEAGGLVNARHAGYFDGTRFVLAYVRSETPTLVNIAERDDADTTTTLRTPTALSDGNVNGIAVTWDNNDNIHLWASGATSRDLKRLKFDRVLDEWDGAWTTVAVDTVAAVQSIHLIASAPTSRHDAIWLDASSNIKHDSVVLNIAPFAPTLVDPVNASVQDLVNGYIFDWAFSDPDPGATQSAWVIRRKVGAGSYEYYDAVAEAWGGALVWNAGSTSQYMFSASKWDKNTTYLWSINTKDEFETPGVFAEDLTVISSGAEGWDTLFI